MSGIDLKDLFEVAMNVREILKVNSVTKEPRTKILYNLITQGQPIELTSGRTVVIDKKKSKEAIAVLARNNIDEISTAFLPKNKIFIAVGGQAFSLNNFLKSQVFGGAIAGHGAGTAQTSVQESAQAIALAVAATKGKRVLAPEDLNIKNIKMSSSKFNVSSLIPEVVALMDDPTWKNSFVITTNALLKKFPTMNRMEFHHQSHWVKALEKAFYAANSFDNKFFSHIDKWNPADIWAVAPGTSTPTPIEASNLVELKAWMQNKFEKKKIIGVSLKKTGKTAEVKIINSDTEVNDLLDITLRKLLVSKTNKLFSAKDSFVLFETSSLGGMLRDGNIFL